MCAWTEERGADRQTGWEQGRRLRCVPGSLLVWPLLSLLTGEGSGGKENKGIVISLSSAKSGHFGPFLRAEAVLFVNSKHVFCLSGSFLCAA